MNRQLSITRGDYTINLCILPLYPEANVGDRVDVDVFENGRLVGLAKYDGNNIIWIRERIPGDLKVFIENTLKNRVRPVTYLTIE
ncbi:MAG: hypothetical protein QXY45_00050 [Candidatus Aenigmatarchaeota archaeon]